MLGDAQPNGSPLPMPGPLVTQPAPFSIVARQERWLDGKLYAVLTFASAFGAFNVWFEGAALAKTLAVLDRLANATSAGIELPPEVPRV